MILGQYYDILISDYYNIILNIIKFFFTIAKNIINFYSLKIDKTGLTKKTKDDGVYAPLILVILSALLCYGLAEKIYI